MKQKSLKINVILNFFRIFFGLLMPLITFPYSSRVLLPEGIGRVNFAQSVISYFAIIAALGIYSYGIREAAKLRDDKLQLSQFVKELFTINLISTGVAYFLLGISIFFIPRFYEYRVLLCICGSIVIFYTIGMEWLYIALEDYSYITIRSIIIQIISVICLFIFVKTKEDYIKYAVLVVISDAGGKIVNAIHLRKVVNFNTRSSINLKRHLKPIFILFATCVAAQIYSALDTTMLGFMCTEWDVGIYSVATKVNRIVLSGLLAIFATMTPRLSYYAKQEDKSEFLELVYKSVDLILLISVPCTVGLNLLSKNVIFLLSGKDFMRANLPMKIMNPIIIVIGINNFFSGQVFLPLNKERNTLIAVIIGTVINFILNFTLIPIYQTTGAAIATLTAESVVCIVNLILVRKIMNISFLLKRFVIYLGNCVVMAIPVLCCMYFIKSDILVLVLSILSGALTYFAMLCLEKNKLVYSVFSGIKLKLNNRINKS